MEGDYEDGANDFDMALTNAAVNLMTKLEAEEDACDSALNNETFGLNDEGDFNAACVLGAEEFGGDEAADDNGIRNLGNPSANSKSGNMTHQEDGNLTNSDQWDCDSGPENGEDRDAVLKSASKSQALSGSGSKRSGAKSSKLGLDCTLCGATFTAPKILHCLHVFDAHCLLNFGAHRGEVITCPTCQCETPILSLSTSAGAITTEQLDSVLPTDNTRVALIELDAIQRQSLKCTSCKTQERACARCADCPGYLCTACLAAHQQMRMFETHSVWRFDELAAAQDMREFHRPVYCTIHKSVKSELYCLTCQRIICKDCRVGQHATHNCDTVVPEFAAGLRSALQARGQAAAKAVHTCSELKDKLQNDLEELALQRDTVRGSIEETYQSYRAVLERTRNAALQRLDSICNEAELLLMGAIDAEDRLAQRIETTSANADRLIGSASDTELVALFAFISARFDALNLLLSADATRDRLARPLGKLTFRTNAAEFERAISTFFGRLVNDLVLFPNQEQPRDSADAGARQVFDDSLGVNVGDLVTTEKRLQLSEEMSIDTTANLLNSLMLDTVMLDGLTQAAQSANAMLPGRSAQKISASGSLLGESDDLAATLAALGSVQSAGLTQPAASLPPSAVDLLNVLKNSVGVTQTTPSLTQVMATPGGAAVSASSLNLAGSVPVAGPLPVGIRPQTSPTSAAKQFLAVQTGASSISPSPTASAASPPGGAGQQAVMNNLLNMLQAAQQMQPAAQPAASFGGKAAPLGTPNSNPNALLGTGLPMPINAALANLLTPATLNPLANLAAIGGGLNGNAQRNVNVNLPPFGAGASLLAAAMNNTANSTGGPAFPTKQANPVDIRCKFGTLGQAKMQFNSPHGFCLGFDEEIVVADTNNHRVQVFNKNGEYKFVFGTAGREEGQLWYPRKVACIRQTGRYVVCDRGNERSRMQLFTKTGQFVRKIAIRYVDIVAGLAISQEGHIVAVDSVTPSVFIMTETGDLVKWFDCSDYMREPSDIAVSGKEYYVCDFKGHHVCVFNEEGTFVRRIGGENITNYPNGIDISDAGDVLIGDSHGNRFHVVVFSRDGTLLGEFECPHIKVSRCCGLKITSEGYIVTLAKNNHHVLVLNTLFIA